MLKLLDVERFPNPPEKSPVLVASLDVTQNTEAERTQILATVKTFYGDGFYWMHDCGHEDNPTKPCTKVEV